MRRCRLLVGAAAPASAAIDNKPHIACDAIADMQKVPSRQRLIKALHLVGPDIGVVEIAGNLRVNAQREKTKNLVNCRPGKAQGVAPWSAVDEVVAIAGIPDEQVITGAEDREIVAATARHGVVALSTLQDVVSGAADKNIVAGAAI